MRTLVIMASVLSTITVTVSHAVPTTSELKLESGTFTPIAGAELGSSVLFDNEIDGHYCYPLYLDGTLIAWFHRAYSLDDELFVQQCDDYYPSAPLGSDRRDGGVNNWWDVVHLNGERREVQFERLNIPDWDFMSNPNFCGPYVAYWGWRGDKLIPSVYELRLGRRTAELDLGIVTIATDNAYFFSSPTWSQPCSDAYFDARPAGKAIFSLEAAP